MLQVLHFSFITSICAFTTHRYDAYDSFGNYRPNRAFLDEIFGYQNGNGYRPVQTYEYIKRHDSVVISDVYKEPVANSDGDRRILDMPYTYENPYQWNRQVSLNRVVVTEPAKLYNRFENTNNDREFEYNPNSDNRQPVVQTDEQEVNNQTKPTNELKSQGNFSVPSKQSDDVNHTLVINEQQITWNNNSQGSSEDNANITIRSINSDSNNTNSLESTKQNAANRNDDTLNRPMKANDATVVKINRSPTTNANTTIQDNEVTPTPNEQRTKANEDDRWVWSDGLTTIKVDVDDRAAFSGNECPSDKQKLGNTCVLKD